MSKTTFTQYLNNEISSVRCVILCLYENRDKLRYIDGPRLEKEYMDKIGTYEETVIKEEIECELLKKKQQMIQAAINRRESINEDEINAELEVYRAQMLKEASGNTFSEIYAELSDEQNEKLQKLYHDIIDNFHPQVYPDLTDVHRRLFQKAQEAYRRRDLSSLKLIHEMLYAANSDESMNKVLLEMLKRNNLDEISNGNNADNSDFAPDYSLVSLIYDSFIHTSEENILKNELEQYSQMADDVMRQIDDMKLTFPYNTSEMLSDPAKIMAYKEELDHRLYIAASERKSRSETIRQMLESEALNG